MCSSRCPKSKKGGVALSQKCLPMDELSAITERERVVMPNTPPSTAAVKRKRRGSRGACTKKEVGGEPCEEKEQKGMDTAVCIIMIYHWPFSVQSIDMAIQRLFCADIITNQL